jgi:hypothetical protein
VALAFPINTTAFFDTFPNLRKKTKLFDNDSGCFGCYFEMSL